MKIDGIPVVDANAPVELVISKADAQSGTKDPATCAAAKAACRVPGVQEARIYRTRSYLLYLLKSGKKVWKRLATPWALTHEIVAFDRGGVFEPGPYKLIPLPKSLHARQRARSAKIAAQKRRGKVLQRGSTPRIIPGIRDTAPRFQRPFKREE